MRLRPLVLASCATLAFAACKPSAPADPGATPANPAAAVEEAVDALNPLSDPAAEVKASMDKFLAAQSFHATMTMEGAQRMANEMDFVAPDRYRMQMPVGTQVIIGDTMYMQAQGRSMKVPLPQGTLTQWRDPLKIQEHKDGMSVEALGDDRVDGQPAKKYLVRHAQPKPSEFTYWVGGDGLPLQLRHAGESQGKAYTMTLRYSRFNDPAIVIDAPQ